MHKGDKHLVRLCNTCGRESRGIAVEIKDEFISLGYNYYCSIKCRELNDMTDWTTRETTAIKRGGYAGGEYLESINKFSLDKLSKEEWQTFLECIIKEYHTAMADKEILHMAELY